MRVTRQVQQSFSLASLGLGRAVPLLGMVLLIGCVSGDKTQFYTYCDSSGCYQCDEHGCAAMQGTPPGGTCSQNTDCAPGCYCRSDGQCAEAGFCDQNSDCASGYTCDSPRHSCEPAPGTGPGTGGTGPGTGGTGPGTGAACKLAADCAPGNECNNGTCQPSPVLANHCVFDRQCGTGGQCVDGHCERACQDNTACGTGRGCVNSVCAPQAPAAGTCAANSQCGAAQTCIDGACHLSCSKDADCQATNTHDVCLSGVCRADEGRVAECRMNADCASGQECEDATCRVFCFASSDCAACTGGANVCDAGYCTSPHEAAPQCKLAADCSGQHCMNGFCKSQ